MVLAIPAGCPLRQCFNAMPCEPKAIEEPTLQREQKARQQDTTSGKRRCRKTPVLAGTTSKVNRACQRIPLLLRHQKTRLSVSPPCPHFFTRINGGAYPSPPTWLMVGGLCSCTYKHVRCVTEALLCCQTKILYPRARRRIRYSEHGRPQTYRVQEGGGYLHSAARRGLRGLRGYENVTIQLSKFETCNYGLA